jgi:uncharacterized protein YndB with AHSA1/START domain
MTTTDTGTRTLEVFRVYIKATPQAIWEAITAPEWNQRYGYHTPATYELSPGGRYEARATAEMKEYGNTPDVVVDGEVLEADPPRKLVQTWRMYFDQSMIDEGYTTVTWEIEPEGDALTKLTVTHDVTGAPIMEHMIQGDGPLGEGGGGWPWILSDLKTLLESGDAMEL